MADPRLGDVLPAEDPVSLWLTSLAWAFGDLQVVHLSLIDEKPLDEGIPAASYFYGHRLAASHLREAARLCGLPARDDHGEIRKFYDSVPAEIQQHLQDVRDAYRGHGEAVRAIRNGFFHYPYPDGYRDGKPRPGQARWDKLADVLDAAKDGEMTFKRGKLREARLLWADDLAADVFSLHIGGVDGVELLRGPIAKAITGLVRFVNGALDCRMVRAARGLPLDEAE